MTLSASGRRPRPGAVPGPRWAAASNPCRPLRGPPGHDTTVSTGRTPTGSEALPPSSWAGFVPRQRRRGTAGKLGRPATIRQVPEPSRTSWITTARVRSRPDRPRDHDVGSAGHGFGHQEAAQADGEEEAPQAAEEDPRPATQQEV